MRLRQRRRDVRGALSRAHMRYRSTRPVCAHASRVCSTLRNKCVFIAAVAVAALLLMPAAARAAATSPPLRSPVPRTRERALRARRWARPIYIRPPVPRPACSHRARGLPLLIKRERARTRAQVCHHVRPRAHTRARARAYPLLRAQAAHERALRGHRSAAHALLR